MRLQKGDKLNYNGLSLTCTDVNYITPDGSVGEDNLEYTFENDSAIVTFRDDEVTRFIADGAEVIHV
jgi:hypothetical protein